MPELKEKYEQRYHETLMPLSATLENFVIDLFDGFDRIDRIVARPKSISRFIQKANKSVGSKLKYEDPLNQIQDQIGVRIVTFYECDVNRVHEHVLKYFRAIESKLVVPDSESEFGYFGQHFILLIPDDITVEFDRDYPPFFELQIKTLFQHSWSEANHDLGYKPSTELTSEIKRQIAFASAQAWGADKIFNDLFKELNGD